MIATTNANGNCQAENYHFHGRYHHPDLSYEYLKSVAAGHWRCAIERICGVDTADWSKAGPCPKCGGNDRFRAFKDFDQTGGVICRKCHATHNSDGFSTVDWLLDCGQWESLNKIAEFLKVGATDAPPPRKPAKKGPPAPAKPDVRIALVARDADPGVRLRRVQEWCDRKQGVSVSAVSASRHLTGLYKGEPVIALAGYLPVDATKPASVTLYRVNGEPFPMRDTAAKNLNLDGSQDAMIVAGDPSLLTTATHVVKCEGPPDAFAVADRLPAGYVAITNACGAKAFRTEFAEMLAGKHVIVIHDQDTDGQAGAQRWVESLAPVAASVVNVQLPYEMVEKGGKDLRDFINEGGRFESLLQASTKPEAEVGKPDLFADTDTATKSEGRPKGGDRINRSCSVATADPSSKMYIGFDGTQGASAAHSAGLNSICRPSNHGGDGHYVEFLCNTPDRRLVIFGERFQTPGGDRLGRHVVLANVEKIADATSQCVWTAMPPAGFASFYDWYLSRVDDVHDPSHRSLVEFRAEVMEHIRLRAIRIDPSPKVAQQRRREQCHLQRSLAKAAAERIEAEAKTEWNDDVDYDRSHSNCTMPVAIRSYNKNGNETVGIGVVSCGSPRCPVCRRRKWGPAWVIRLTGHFTQVESLFVTAIPVAEWSALRKRIIRAGGEYATSRLADEKVIVVTDVEINDGGAWESVDVTGAADLAHRLVMLADVSGTGNPLNTSSGWGAPKATAEDWSHALHSRLADPKYAEVHVSEGLAESEARAAVRDANRLYASKEPAWIVVCQTGDLDRDRLASCPSERR